MSTDKDQPLAKIASSNDEAWQASVRSRAYSLWEHEGRPDGHAERHWVQAERELTARLVVWRVDLDAAPDSKMALDAHERRARTLHEILSASASKVQKWGFTDSEKSHEHVVLDILRVLPDPHDLAVMAGTAIGGAIVRGLTKPLTDTVGEWVNTLIVKLWRAMKDGKIGKFEVSTANGSLFKSENLT